MTPQLSALIDSGVSDRLLSMLGRRCRHVSAIVGPEAPVWQEALARYAGDVVRALPAADHRQQFKTVIAVDASADATPESLETLAREAWPIVASGGLLLVVAPNGDAARPRQPVTMRELTRRLRPLGSPTFLGDQPFRWIVAEVRKRRSALRPPPARMDRYEATVRLCRGDVIELGCGPGDLSALIHARGYRVVGADINAPKILEARRRYPDLQFLRCDITAIDGLDESFDTAVLAEVLEHVPEATGDAMLDRAWAMLRPGGRLIVSVPNEHLVPHRNHVREFSVRSLAGLLRRFGRAVFSSDQPFKWLLAHVDKP